MTTNLNQTIKNLGKILNQIIVGQPVLIDQLIVALLAGGHVILEGVPGTGKTLLAQTLARLIQADFRRIQLTPDILPADILGTNIYDLNSRQFTLKKGPVFTELLLADEINRTPPKTQAALLEAMEEQQVTLDGESLGLPALFWVMATQNSVEFEGTYPLPEAQLDRFLFKLVVDYPEAKAEKQMLLNSLENTASRRRDLAKIQPITNVEQVLQARHEVRQIKVAENILDYLINLIQKSRQHSDLALGASPRAGVAWLQAAKAYSWLNGRDFVTPDEVKKVAIPLLRHRLMLKPESLLDGVEINTVIKGLLTAVPVPR